MYVTKEQYETTYEMFVLLLDNVMKAGTFEESYDKLIRIAASLMYDMVIKKYYSEVTIEGGLDLDDHVIVQMAHTILEASQLLPFGESLTHVSS